MANETGHCTCGATKVKAPFNVYDYEGAHTGPNNDRKCRHRLCFATQPAGGDMTHIDCPECGEPHAQFRKDGSHQVSRWVCPRGCP